MNKNKIHEFVSGQPRKGKSYYVQEKIKEKNIPCLYISTKEEDFKGFIKADSYSPLQGIDEALKEGKRVFYKVDFNRDFYLKEIYYLVKIAFAMKKNGKNLLMVFDECHNYAREGEQENDIFRVAQEGLYEIQAIFISQFPSAVPKRIIRSCELHTFFSMTNYEEKYYKNYGFETDLIKAGLINQFDKVQVLNGVIV